MSVPTTKSLRIAIATLGRFHVLDLARELDALGHQVHFYSYVPRRRATQFGLPPHCHVALLPWLFPVLVLARMLRAIGLADAAEAISHHAVDSLVAWKLRRCDVFIGMSGIFLRAFNAARRRYGAAVVVERGSVHIEAQREILRRVQHLNPKAHGVSSHSVRRELAAYNIADCICVPSLHAEDSFLKYGIPASKLFRNPYGVDLSMFHPDVSIQRNPRMILFAGNWSYQKGVDLLTQAMHVLAPRGYALWHVGSIADAPTPKEEWFHPQGHVDQPALADWYQRAGCLVLPSRQEGLALVQLQAASCGCPVVGSTMTGARDLRRALGESDLVRVIEVDNVQAIIDSVEAATGTSIAHDFDAIFRTTFSWDAYATRYDALLQRLTSDTRTMKTVKPSPRYP